MDAGGHIEGGHVGHVIIDYHSVRRMQKHNSHSGRHVKQGLWYNSLEACHA